MNDVLSPALIVKLADLAKEGGLAFTLVIVLILYGLEWRRGLAKDKVIEGKDKAFSDLQGKTLEAIGEMKTAVSNCNLLLEMLTRGRR